jgi:hypothetical protein
MKTIVAAKNRNEVSGRIVLSFPISGLGDDDADGDDAALGAGVRDLGSMDGRARRLGDALGVFERAHVDRQEPTMLQTVAVLADVVERPTAGGVAQDCRISRDSVEVRVGGRACGCDRRRKGRSEEAHDGDGDAPEHGRVSFTPGSGQPSRARRADCKLSVHVPRLAAVGVGC